MNFQRFQNIQSRQIMKVPLSRLLVIPLIVFSFQYSYCQGFNDSKTSVSNFLKRMYSTSPFEGVKVIEDYDNNYLISVLSLDKSKYTSQATMNRVAQVKAQQQANTFFNGSFIASEMIIQTNEVKNGESTNSIVQTFETIKENSLGFVKGMELLTTFDIEEGKRMLFIFFKEMKEAKKIENRYE